MRATRGPVTLPSVPAPIKISPAQVPVIRAALDAGESRRSVAKRFGVSPDAVVRALSRIPEKVRTAKEFKGAEAFVPQTRSAPLGSWTLETIRCARDDQMAGNFKQPVRLAEALRTDDALFVAYHNRLAPHNAIATRLVPCADTARGEATAKKASASAFVSRTVLEGILGTMANHGIAIGYNEHEPSDDGTRVDFRLTEWPLEHVKWNRTREALETTTRQGERVDIVHGDGRWVVFRKFLVLPWTQEACVLPASLIWAAHAEGLADWAGSSKSHGLARLIGTMQEGISTHGADGVLTPEAQGLLDTLLALVTGSAPAGIIPFGAKADFAANSSTAWQVFNELIQNREKAAARIYQGTDAAMGSIGGAPGVDISILFGVATTKVQGDFEAIEQALSSGFYQPWAAVNDGDSRYAPRLKYLLPDPDAKARSEEQAQKRDRFHAEVERLKKNGFVVDQTVVDRVAADVGLDDPPKLASVEQQTTSLVLAPTDVARVVRVLEARASQGLPPFGDARDNMTLPELEEAAKAKAAAATAQSTANAEAQAAAVPAPAAAP